MTLKGQNACTRLWGQNRGYAGKRGERAGENGARAGENGGQAAKNGCPAGKAGKTAAGRRGRRKGVQPAGRRA